MNWRMEIGEGRLEIGFCSNFQLPPSIFGDPPDEIARKLPYLRLAQIFGALSYYDDHRDEIERYIVLNRVPVEDEPTG